ncbi:hypothetical protein SAMN02982929_04538 [Saccharopolyspora kobensis]|uniref:Uncharacterized protein n=1 Tax=Saccharopolyspora kobensis TaxID=146035 RepID=A0A1H6DKN9_9PSEU|nr:hypothetical protein [Saccharopolyspora kobensis]SEG85155.1 hypothetical protein SAMN02982929_04538 [Saccharopolyspora kobensis]SFD25307.1 hypothetical protein SAMN05216506_103251 [Saccharopolyspora kobensis]
MAMSTQILDPTPTTDWFAEPLAAIRSLFAAQLPDGAETPDSATTLPPPTSGWRDWAPPTAGETVDTSQATPEHSPVAGTGAARAVD